MTLRADVAMERPGKFLGKGYLGGRITFHHPAEGEAREGAGAMEAILLGVGACTATDVVDILRKQRERVDDLRIEIEAERAAEPPQVFTRIHLRYVVRGPAKESNVGRAVRLSMERYCSAAIMLTRAGVEVTTSHVLESP